MYEKVFMTVHLQNRKCKTEFRRKSTKNKSSFGKHLLWQWLMKHISLFFLFIFFSLFFFSLPGRFSFLVLSLQGLLLYLRNKRYLFCAWKLWSCVGGRRCLSFLHSSGWRLTEWYENVRCEQREENNGKEEKNITDKRGSWVKLELNPFKIQTMEVLAYDIII